MNKRWLDHVIRIGGLDFHVLLTLLFRSWSIVAGAAMVLFIPIWFTRVEQGYYYTFASLIALQVFFELGMNQVVVQIVSHELAKVSRLDNGELTGDEQSVGRLISLNFLLRRWYSAAALFFMVGVSIAGILFFIRHGELPVNHWAGPWLLLVAASAANLLFSPSLAIMEGFGDMGEVARVRLIQSMMGYSAMWIGLTLGAELWAVPLVPAISAIVTGYWLRTRATALNWMRVQDPDQPHKVSWRSEILPFQWRIALSWISGYFIFQLFVPLVFSHQGAAEAGRLGIALAIFNALFTVGMSWVNAKLPQFTRLIANGERAELNALFVSVLVRSTGFTFITSTAAVLVSFVISRCGFDAVHRIASPTVMLCLGLATVANSLVFAAAAYMRAHRVEPMLPVSVAGALLTLPAVYFGSIESVFLSVFLYLIIAMGVCLPWTAAIFAPFYRRAA